MCLGPLLSLCLCIWVFSTLCIYAFVLCYLFFDVPWFSVVSFSIYLGPLLSHFVSLLCAVVILFLFLRLRLSVYLWLLFSLCLGILLYFCVWTLCFSPLLSLFVWTVGISLTSVFSMPLSSVVYLSLGMAWYSVASFCVSSLCFVLCCLFLSKLSVCLCPLLFICVSSLFLGLLMSLFMCLSSYLFSTVSGLLLFLSLIFPSSV